jgi:hypothetical protein
MKFCILKLFLFLKEKFFWSNFEAKPAKTAQKMISDGFTPSSNSASVLSPTARLFQLAI